MPKPHSSFAHPLQSHPLPLMRHINSHSCPPFSSDGVWARTRTRFRYIGPYQRRDLVACKPMCNCTDRQRTRSRHFSSSLWSRTPDINELSNTGIMGRDGDKPDSALFYSLSVAVGRITSSPSYPYLSHPFLLPFLRLSLHGFTSFLSIPSFLNPFSFHVLSTVDSTFVVHRAIPASDIDAAVYQSISSVPTYEIRNVRISEGLTESIY